MLSFALIHFPTIRHFRKSLIVFLHRNARTPRLPSFIVLLLPPIVSPIVPVRVACGSLATVFIALPRVACTSYCLAHLHMVRTALTLTPTLTQPKELNNLQIICYIESIISVIFNHYY